jgi:hypothetical protein
MKRKILIVSVLVTTLASIATAQDVKEFLGRWDMTATPRHRQTLSAMDGAYG